MTAVQTSEPTAKIDWLTAGAWALLIAGLAAAFGRNFGEMWHRWYPAWHYEDISAYDAITQGQSYYTHAPLVPVVSLAVMLLLIKHTSVPVKRRFGWGLVVLIGAVLFHLTACLARVNFASGFAFVGVLAGLIWYLWGTRALLRLWFPVVFLVFMMPLPEVSIAQLNFRLKIAAADWGVQMANMIGVVVERSGNQVFLDGGKSMVIANVCNGLRTLISVVAFGALYAYICRLRGGWRVFLFLMSVPVAVVANALRIVSLIVVADIWTVQIATGWYHDLSGVLILVMAFVLMFTLERLVLWGHKMAGRPVAEQPLFHAARRNEEDANQARQLIAAAGGRRGWVAVTIIALVAAGSWWLSLSRGPVYSHAALHDSLPSDVEIGGSQWYSYVVEFDRSVLVVLETEDAILRRYVNQAGTSVDFCVVFSKDNRKGTHPPDLCLEGAGQDIVVKNDIVVSGFDYLDNVPCRELIVQSGRRRTYYLYTYKCGGRYTGSFWRQQFTIFASGVFSRDAAGALIRVSTPITTSIDEARERTLQFARMGVPRLDKVLP